jgi:hypothetical protein
MQTPPPIPDLLTRLATFASNIQKILSDEDQIDWGKRPSPEQWSLTEIVCHMRDVEREVYHARFETMIKQVNAFIPGVSPDEWAEERGYAAQNGRQALNDFLTARGETVDLLKSLPPELWDKQGQHAYFGPTSMQELVYLSVRHDDIHWEQIRGMLA